MSHGQPLNKPQTCATLSDSELRKELERIETQLLPLLINIQRLLGKEPTVLTREQRRAMSRQQN